MARNKKNITDGAAKLREAIKRDGKKIPLQQAVKEVRKIRRELYEKANKSRS